MTKFSRDAEIETINSILNFERQNLLECTNRLSEYDDKAKELGVEIRPVLKRQRGVNNLGQVKDYDIQRELKLPQFYTSRIICYAYKDGIILTEQEDYDRNVTSFFTMGFQLVKAWKKGNIELNESPFDNAYSNFDSAINLLFKQISEYLQAPQKTDVVTDIPFKNAAFKMPIDDVFELNKSIGGLINGVFVTGHIEIGTIKPNSSVIIADSSGEIHLTCVVNGIMLQSDMLKLKKKMLMSASKGQMIGLFFSDMKVLNRADSGMFVVIE